MLDFLRILTNYRLFPDFSGHPGLKIKINPKVFRLNPEGVASVFFFRIVECHQLNKLTTAFAHFSIIYYSSKKTVILRLIFYSLCQFSSFSSFFQRSTRASAYSSSSSWCIIESPSYTWYFELKSIFIINVAKTDNPCTRTKPRRLPGEGGLDFFFLFRTKSILKSWGFVSKSSVLKRRKGGGGGSNLSTRHHFFMRSVLMFFFSNQNNILCSGTPRIRLREGLFCFQIGGYFLCFTPIIVC